MVNQGAGNDLALGCVDAVMSGLVGGVQAVVPGQAAADITGWAVDPDAPTSAVTVSIVAHSATGDTTLGQLPADVDVPALAASFPGVGTDHGFGAAVPATPGPQNICAVATTVQTGRTVQLGCQDVVIPGSVLGNLDTLRQSGANLTATGWGMDQAAMTTVLQATVRHHRTAGQQHGHPAGLPAPLGRPAGLPGKWWRAWLLGDRADRGCRGQQDVRDDGRPHPDQPGEDLRVPDRHRQLNGCRFDVILLL